jgi:hypothetical protein
VVMEASSNQAASGKVGTLDFTAVKK